MLPTILLASVQRWKTLDCLSVANTLACARVCASNCWWCSESSPFDEHQNPCWTHVCATINMRLFVRYIGEHVCVRVCACVCAEARCCNSWLESKHPLTVCPTRVRCFVTAFNRCAVHQGLVKGLKGVKSTLAFGVYGVCRSMW